MEEEIKNRGEIVKIIITIAIVIMFVITYIRQSKLAKDNKEKEYLQILMIIFFIPAFIIMLDIWDFFAKYLPTLYESFTEKYDMLSLIGTYLGALVSSILLVIITTKDREENIKNIQESQRPYLDVRYPILKKEFLNIDDRNNTIFYHSKHDMNKDDVEEYIALEISNEGETVAIIDINNTKVQIKYNFACKDTDGNITEYVKIYEPNINTGIPRLSLGKGKKVTIIFLYKELYKEKKLNKSNVTYSNIKYRDLFNKKYEDECKRDEEGLQIVIKDNKKIEE